MMVMSPLTNLAAIGQFDLLHSLYDKLYIAEAVWDDVNIKSAVIGGKKNKDDISKAEKLKLDVQVFN
jgi:predicted nucleic acid-binding protein